MYGILRKFQKISVIVLYGEELKSFFTNVALDFGCISLVQFSENGHYFAFLVRRQHFIVRLHSEMWVFETKSWKSILWYVPLDGMVSHYCFIGH